RPAARGSSAARKGNRAALGALGDQRDGAAAVLGRATAARQRCREHGRLARAAPPIGGPDPLRNRRPPPRPRALLAAGEKVVAAADRTARPRSGALQPTEERVRHALRSLDPPGAEQLH